MIRVEHLCKKFGEFTAVDDISFEVAQGDIFAFLGPNGAGKTTTIKMLTTLLRLPLELWRSMVLIRPRTPTKCGNDSESCSRIPAWMAT